MLLAGAGEPFGAVAGLEDVELLGQHELVGQRLAQVGVVVDHQDFLQGAHPSSPSRASSCWLPNAARNNFMRTAHGSVSARVAYVSSPGRLSGYERCEQEKVPWASA